MSYDVVIIGAGLSGLAAGIRLAYFGKRVVICERHYAYGGLNSFYNLNGRQFDVGLHALTNYAPRGAPGVPLTKLLRQLRIDWEELKLCPQVGSSIAFPHHSLRFTNDFVEFRGEVARVFPKMIDGFDRLTNFIREFDDVRIDAQPMSARATLAEYISDPILMDMLLCPLMFYGSPTEHDMDFTHFATLFKSIFLQGFSRPVGGVRTMLTLLVKKFRSLGGKLRMRCGVRRIISERDVVRAVELDNREQIDCSVVLSLAGYVETMRMAGREHVSGKDHSGRLSFVETVLVLNRLPSSLGFTTTIRFASEKFPFIYARPDTAVDTSSSVVCCPSNYVGQDEGDEAHVRLTWLANYDRWVTIDEDSYRRQKEQTLTAAVDYLDRVIPGLRHHVVASDMFTPRTIEKFTGHIGGAVYGYPEKRRDGRTPWRNLFLCGTDQGYLGIIGAMLSGVTIANMHVLLEG